MNTDCTIPLKINLKVSKFKSTAILDRIVPQKCPNCSFLAISDLLFIRHFSVNARRCKAAVKCQYCEFKFKTRKYLNKHIAAKHLTDEEKEQRWHKCPDCEYKASERSKLNAHFSRKHSDKWLTCEFCDYKTKVDVELGQHIRKKHSTNTKVKCKFCNARVEKNLLNRHVAIKHMETKYDQYRCEGGGYKCLHCDYKHNLMSRIQKHVRARHLTEEEKQEQWHKCEMCDYRCSEIQRMTLHVFRLHSDKDQLEWLRCDFCKYKTKVKANLASHIAKRHTDKRLDGTNPKVACHICNSVMQKTYLKTHIAQVHEKRFMEQMRVLAQDL